MKLDANRTEQKVGNEIIEYTCIIDKGGKCEKWKVVLIETLVPPYLSGGGGAVMGKPHHWMDHTSWHKIVRIVQNSTTSGIY